MHLVLLGDSIFDNAVYVNPGESVSEHLARLLPADVALTRLAIDGDMSANVYFQLDKLPATATHIALSSGGNDALAVLPLLEAPCTTLSDALRHLSGFQQKFQNDYLRLKQRLAERALPVLVCTIYDAVPGLPAHLKTALSLFNDVISQSANKDLNDCLDLRIFLTECSDFSAASPIEPSGSGGQKIAAHIASWITSYQPQRG